ncbi:trehalase [Pseudomonas sp. SCT]|uniref:glycoside hydrolase family 15 protein n=1 Tax=Pseudomonas sp. (strain SCT) TaxID=412955 RepID=UPI000ED9DB00|nr:glycoside hydrolase family 15 protein [Pseudomonas sp. SCT]GCA58254.1 trehalase [Pseudomonas sp. SCT]
MPGIYKQLPIALHGLIGDRRSAALVGCDGSIPWLCLPRYDGAPLFGALLDPTKGGHWCLGPAGGDHGHQRYVDDSAALTTSWALPDAVLELTDIMLWPEGTRSGSNDERRIVLRQLRCTSGSTTARLQLVPRWDFAAHEPLETVANGACFRAGGHAIGFWSSRPVRVAADRIEAEWALKVGEEIWLALGLGLDPRHWQLDEARHAAQEANLYWQRWASGIHYTGPRQHFVRRSALIVHLLSYAPSGALVAAPTASLPERIGGERNYDYRFAWIRDASLSLAVLSMFGDTATAQAYMDWLAELQPGPSMPLQVLYRIDGSTELTQHTRDDLAGYRDSRPVLFGNHAADQNQIDSLGYFAECALIYLDQGGNWRPEYWSLLCRLAEHVLDHWRNPGNGIWELPGSAVYTSSVVMSWVVLDRTIRIGEKLGMSVPSPWRSCRDTIREDVLTYGWSDALGAFRQRYGADSLDASVLLIAVMELLPATDPRVLATAERIEQELCVDGWVYRFNDDPSGPGHLTDLVQYEGAFLPCTFWLATTWAKAGQPGKAEAILDRIENLAADLGLLPEEVDPRSGAFLGNMPLMFSHAEYLRAATETAKATLPGKLRMMPGALAQAVSKYFR